MQEYSIPGLHAAYKEGRLTCVQVVQEYIDRIDQWDGKVNAIISMNPDAYRQANELDARLKLGKPMQPLHGVPVLIKDNIDTLDPMPTTAGSLAMTENRATKDAFIVARLRAAGAIILGKTNLSEWANFRGHRSISGWSSVGGLTRNPHVLNRTACGSSSGSGVAVAANFCVVALGTETDGSIVCPAQTNGVVGVKPTLGWLSRSGIVPIAPSQDTAGPMARSVVDAALMLNALAGWDPLDQATEGGKGRVIDFTRALNNQRLQGARIGIARAWMGTDARLMAHLDHCIDLLKQAGATVIDAVAVRPSDDFSDDEMTVLYYEYKAALNQYLANSPAAVQVRSLDELIAWNLEHAAETLRYFGQEHLSRAAEKGGLDSREYQKALARAKCAAGVKGIDAVLHQYRLDAIVTLSGGPAWTIDMVLGDNHDSGIDSTSAAAVSGNPHVTVPAGLVAGLPVGLSFIGAAWNDANVLGLAHAFEQRCQGRVPPRFLPSLEP